MSELGLRRKGFPKYRIRDKVHNTWLTWDICWDRREALIIAIKLCKRFPGRAVRIEEVPSV